MHPVARALPFTLAATRSRAGLVDRLGRRLERVGLQGVLADLDRAAEAGPVTGAAGGEGVTWDAFDRSDTSWWPQGVATIDSGDVLLVSWYAERRRLVLTEGTRISVLHLAAPQGPRYRHVLLVRPRRRLGVPGMGPVRVHAGGIAVSGQYLFVADTLSGVRIFRLGDVMRVKPAAGRPGYDYVLPQLGAFQLPLCAGRGRLRYSFLSTGEVDGLPQLVVGEYRRKGGAPRLLRYPLDPRTGLPAVDDRGRCTPDAVHEGQPNRMQGAAVHGSTWFVTASAGRSAGDLYVGTPGRWRRHRGVLPSGVEDLTWARPGEELWCVSEHQGERWVFPIAADCW
jgi:hypothetical protein